MKKVLYLIFLLCLALTISVYAVSGYAKPKRAAGMMGIKLGDTVDRVKEVLGEPKPIDESEQSLSYRTQGYPVAIFIFYSDGKNVDGIAVYDPSYGVNILGISIGTDAKKVKAIFGKPDSVMVDKNNKQYATWDYLKKYNLQFGLDNGKVNMILISTP